jgi:uncharacterized protein YegL
MKQGLTELIFILDRSGSMGGLEADTIGGYNSLLTKQKAIPGECRITTVLFSHSAELLHDRTDLQAVSLLTDADYRVGGSTALLDAIGSTLNKIGNAIKHTAEDFRPEKVLVAIITDGEENASRYYGSDQVKHMIKRQQDKYGWEFLFLGANIDAVETASRYGIRAERASRYHADKAGMDLNYGSMSETIVNLRVNKTIDDHWKQAIDDDFKKRSQ